MRSKKADMKFPTNNLNIIVKMIFGSHLYGTNTETSDRDFKGIFMPSRKQVLLGHIPKSFSFSTAKKSRRGQKNEPKDIDTEIYSFHYFIKLACEGQTVALDMLYAPEKMILESSQLWDDIVKNRNRFLTKNIQAFVGYARKQAAKYGIKGSRLEAANRAMKEIRKYGLGPSLGEIWDLLPVGEHLSFVTDDRGNRFYQVCGRKLHDSVSFDYAYNDIKKFYDNYGELAIDAEVNINIDWKAISHALRAAFEVEELLRYGTITFPLKQAELLKSVKKGELDYVTEVAPMLEKMMDWIEQLSKISHLPDEVDRKFWDDFIIEKTFQEIMFEASL